jgi:hypothetical protein
MKCWKLTDQDGVTKNDTQWGINASHETSGEGKLYSRGWIHAYEDNYLALLLNPMYAGFASPRLWEAEASGEIKRDSQLKFGCTKPTTIKEVKLPVITTEMRVRFAILAVMEVYKDEKWTAWARAWLDGSDRSKEAAHAAGYVADAARYAAYAAGANAAWCADDAAWYAADAAWYAAGYAADASNNIDLVAIAHKATET